MKKPILIPWLISFIAWAMPVLFTLLPLPGILPVCLIIMAVGDGQWLLLVAYVIWVAIAGLHMYLEDKGIITTIP